MNRDTRIVITGMGWITPLGHDLDTVWSKLAEGVSGIRPIERFDASSFPTTFGATVRDYDFTAYVKDPALHAHAGKNSQFALGAARQAWDQAGLDGAAGLDRRRIGMYLGAGEGVLDFDNYAKTDIEAWDDAARALNPLRWAEAAMRNLDPWREIEQEPN
ncbi:MAG: beta-ketoacyl synthase N-terminal-like domain-containing protein, partial [Planctomycetota bacterium]|nr:beta-ketoacyl synthase N-terminal-like domain-containing protein [Planctomycetota bacterium]